MKQYKLAIKGLDCANCAENIQRKIEKIEGIRNVKVNFIMQKLVFECLEEASENITEQIKKIIKKEEPNIKIEAIK